MSTPVQEIPQPRYPANNGTHSQSDDDEGTLSGEHDRLKSPRGRSVEKEDYIGGQPAAQSLTREEEHRLTDDLAMLQAERVVSNAQSARVGGRLTNSTSMRRSRSRVEPADQFDINTNPIHEKTATFRPPEHPAGRFAKTFKKLHESSVLIRYFFYIVPVVLIILIPLLLGALLFKSATIGDVRLMWFCVWLEIVWLTLWSGRASHYQFILQGCKLTRVTDYRAITSSTRWVDLQPLYQQQQEMEGHVQAIGDPRYHLLLDPGRGDIISANHDPPSPYGRDSQTGLGD